MEREQARELGSRGGEDGAAPVVPAQSSLEPAELRHGLDRLKEPVRRLIEAPVPHGGDVHLVHAPTVRIDCVTSFTWRSTCSATAPSTVDDSPSCSQAPGANVRTTESQLFPNSMAVVMMSAT